MDSKVRNTLNIIYGGVFSTVALFVQSYSQSLFKITFLQSSLIAVLVTTVAFVFLVPLIERLFFLIPKVRKTVFKLPSAEGYWYEYIDDDEQSFIDIKYSSSDQEYILVGSCFDFTDTELKRTRRFTSKGLIYKNELDRVNYNYKADIEGGDSSRGIGVIEFDNAKKDKKYQEATCYFADKANGSVVRKSKWTRISETLVYRALGKSKVDDKKERKKIMEYISSNKNEL